MNKVSIIGCGTWATALTTVVANNIENVMLWTIENDVADEINSVHSNSKYIENVTLASNITATTKHEDLKDSDFIMLVIPAQIARKVLDAFKGIVDGIPILICTKGIENSTQCLMSEVVEQLLPNSQIAALSGPNFAKEVALGTKSATTIACSDRELGEKIKAAFATDYFKPYLCDDVIGVQLAGALKNIVAIASGIVEGRGLGENVKAMVIAQGMIEMAELIEKMGGNQKTLITMAGVGDLILTASSTTSRNMNFGYKIGQGIPRDDILKEGITVEGYFTAISVNKLVQKYGLEMPVFNDVYDICYSDNIEDSITKLISLR